MGALPQVRENTLIAESDCAENRMALTDSIAANSTVMETPGASNSVVAKSGGLAVIIAMVEVSLPHGAHGFTS